jgi:hypothetical protein
MEFNPIKKLQTKRMEGGIFPMVSYWAPWAPSLSWCGGFRKRGRKALARKPGIARGINLARGYLAENEKACPANGLSAGQGGFVKLWGSQFSCRLWLEFV